MNTLLEIIDTTGEPNILEQIFWDEELVKKEIVLQRHIWEKMEAISTNNGVTLLAYLEKVLLVHLEQIKNKTVI